MLRTPVFCPLIALIARGHSGNDPRRICLNGSHGPVGKGSIFLGSEPEASTTLVVAEGIETGLTRRLVGPADIHACAGGLRFVEPNGRHRRVEILADTEKRPQARQLARRYATMHKLAAFVVTVPDTLGPKCDLNDALLDLGAGAVLAAVEDAERIERVEGTRSDSPYARARLRCGDCGSDPANSRGSVRSGGRRRRHDLAL